MSEVLSRSHGLPQRLGRVAEECRMCLGTNLHRYLDLGHMPPADQFRRRDQLREPVVSFPLDVNLCRDCGLSQLGYVVDPEFLYEDDYPYESSTTRAGRLHFRRFAGDVAQRFEFGQSPLAVDVGSNVGVLLSGFAEEGYRVLGVDPAPNIVAIARERGIPSMTAFFSADVAERIVEEHGPASVVTATNVFAHVDDLAAFMEALGALLASDGIFVLEAPYLVNLLTRLEYDTIYHEHLSYLAIRPLIPFFERFGMRIFDAREVDIHGGSIRIFVDRGRREVEGLVIDRLLSREDAGGAYDLGRLARFADDVARNREELTALLATLKASGKRLAGVSAPAKGMTLLNYCRIGQETLTYVTEKSQLKIGRVTPGMHIPVVPDDELLVDPPDFALLLAWNFAEEILENLQTFRDRGGSFIVPIPEPRVISPGDRA